MENYQFVEQSVQFIAKSLQTITNIEDEQLANQFKILMRLEIKFYMDKLSPPSYFQNISEFKFLQRKRLGKGSFGQVRLAVHLQTSKIYAIKIINPHEMISDSGMKALQRQITIHSHINHPHIIKLWQVLYDDSKIYMVMEYAEHGNLFYHQNEKATFSEVQASIFFAQTMAAIEHLHSLNYVHRDLKPENLLLDKDYNIKICDLGWVVQGINQTHQTFCGTYEYMAPQMIFDREYDHKIDIWALGILLYQLLHGFAPFQGEKIDEVRQSMLKGEIHVDPALSQNVQGLIFNILKVDPKERLTIAEIKTHAWLIQMKKKRLAQQVSLFACQKNDILKTEANKSRDLHVQLKGSPKVQPLKGNSSKNLLIGKQNKKSSSNIKSNISGDQISLIKCSKQKNVQKQNLLKYLKKISSKRQIQKYKTQNSDLLQNEKVRLKTQVGLSIGNRKKHRNQMVRFETEFGSALDLVDDRVIAAKKRRIPTKKCMGSNLLKTYQKPTAIRKSID